MTGIREAEGANERVLVASLPDGLLRSRLPEPWKLPETIEKRTAREVSKPAEPPVSLAGRGQAVARATASLLELEVARGIFFLLFPVFAGCGAVLYFTLSFEPDWLPVLAVLTGLAALRILARRHFLVAQFLTLALAFQLGLVGGKWETERKTTPMLGSDVSTRVTGRVVALDYQDNGSWRVTLDLLRTERPTLRFAPQRIRVAARDIPAQTAIGSGVTGLARLRVQSGPVRPGNYDFAFHAYFNGLGASGFFLGTPKIADVPPASGLAAALSEWIAMLRVRVSERVEEVIGGEDGNVAAALIAGTRAGISEQTNEDLRKAGLAHILSISGLHMALAAGIVMLALRSAFALFPAFSVRHPVKKYAAFLSLISSAFYLAMSGADVAAQRSYVMIAVMLCAVLADREAISIRNLAIAGMAMIALSPHEVLGPSFQMSFSATAGLIAVYAWWSERNARKRLVQEQREVAPTFLSRLFAPAFATAGTSLVAGIASGIFAAYHFNNTAPLGLFGNVFALPAISILVMPFAVLGLVLMPLGLDWLPLQIVGAGILVVRHIAAFIAVWSPDGNPGAMPVASLVLWTVALLIVVTFATRLKFLSLIFVIAGFIAFFQNPYPDIVIAEDARLVGVRLPDGRLALNRNRPSKFTIENWQKAYLVSELIPPLDMKNGRKIAETDGFVCDDGLCTISLRDGRILAYTADSAVRDVACDVGDVVVLAIAGERPTCDRPQKLVLNRRDLALKGAAEIRLGDTPSEDVQLASVKDERPEAAASSLTEANHATIYSKDKLTFAVDAPSRPWHLYRLYSRAARGLADRADKKTVTRDTKPDCPAGEDGGPGVCN